MTTKHGQFNGMNGYYLTHNGNEYFVYSSYPAFRIIDTKSGKSFLCYTEEIIIDCIDRNKTKWA